MHDLEPELREAVASEFELIRRLGTGNMGTVFLARETDLRRLVAIKIPRPELAGDTEVCRRIEREALAAARIRHPSAAEVHRIGHLPNGVPYLVQEYVEGRKLTELLSAEGPFDEPTAILLLMQVADALAAAHEAGVVHRDVRPDNIFWHEKRRLAVLTDFGIAGILESGSEVVSRLTLPGQPLGDPAYRSPEQLLAEIVGPPADIYGLGLLGYELLALEGPYLATSRAERAAAHLRTPPRELEDMVPGTDPELASLLRRCLAKDPGRRPTARAVVRQLDAIRAASARASSGTPPRPAPLTLESALEDLPAFSRFLSELRRRRVFSVALVYIGFFYLVLQAADLILPALPLPEWSYDGLVAAVLAGFPVAMVLTWMYDLTIAGIQRTESADLGGPGYFRWLLPALGLAVSLALAVAIGWWVLRGG